MSSATLEAADALVLARFWAAVFGSDVDEESTPDKAYLEAAGWGGPNIWFARVPEGKTAKNRLHFDLRADRSSTEAELDRLLSLGATRVDVGQGPDVSWVVLADPGGNEFCLLERTVQEVEVARGDG